ncbi:glycosyltransferase family 2 protein [Thalassobellus suaedae]|uniref:Glycosyltransferase n=1 Tax=Thalassobellus suaedae TaxID=3074124 RepID=A0ABY9Y076_9FLAO|nr:glycosyltransferase [Flavobacteriaceae bacterium HL-DH10]
MQTSILIVSKDRKQELKKTLEILEKSVDYSSCEILVFLDGCIDGSHVLKSEFPKVFWYESEKSLGASSARNTLYSYGRGDVFIGLDDDAHPLQSDFVDIVHTVFNENKNLGIIAFHEIKGVFNSDEEALLQKSTDKIEFLCNSFVGCGFAIQKEVYESTNGFPIWIDIYGEESCVAIEVLANNKDILYTNNIVVNHRVNKQERLNNGRNYYRFGKQLKNTAFYYIVYYRNPVFKLLKLFWHNFTKYALVDKIYFRTYIRILGLIIFQSSKVLKHRKPVEASVLKRVNELNSPVF